LLGHVLILHVGTKIWGPDIILVLF
jgi:hypothetical protein